VPESGRWALILHGGAKDVAAEQEAANRAGCLSALLAGRAVLEDWGSAVDAVEAAVRSLEGDPTFNAGYGSVLNARGEVEMDASLMDGSSLDIGGVAAIQGVRHPISGAKAMLRQKPLLLAGVGARRFAEEVGAELCDPVDMISPEQRSSEARRGYDTVGCVALDRSGVIACGTSTGGLSGKWQGRVGDSPLPGCGFYADSRIGGLSLSGEGEAIARMLLAARVMQGLETQGLDAAMADGLAALARVGGEAGIIGLDRQGRVGWAHNSRDFAVAYATSETEAPRVHLRKSEEKAGGANG
jgi:L-asparaginase / beta-aspartyl-peptidase